MSMPYVHLERRLNFGGPLSPYDDEFAGFVCGWSPRCGIVAEHFLRCADLRIGRIRFQMLAIARWRTADNGAGAGIHKFCQPPISGTLRRLAEHCPVAVHCEAGIGRTGTMLALYLISQGESAESAIRRVRTVRRSAVETGTQI